MARNISTGFILVLCIAMGIRLFAGDISLANSGSFNLTSRTSFGIDLDNTYRYGLKQELTDFQLVINLVPYQKLNNRVKSDTAVGFINLTLFNLDLVTSEGLGYNAGVPDSNGAYLRRNRFQTGEFLAGIAKGNWILQMNAGANEPFWSPWNKGLEFVNDGVKFTWSYLDSMVDVKRINPISSLKPEDPLVAQFQQDTKGPTDNLGVDIGGATIAALYTVENRFGLNLKFATEYPYNSDAITPYNRNGLAAGIDSVIIPSQLESLKLFISVGGSYEYGLDANSDPFMMGSKIGYNIPLNDDLALEPYAGADVGIKIKEAGSYDSGEYEVATGVTFHWPGLGGWYTDYILNRPGRVFPGLSLAYKVYSPFSRAIQDAQHSIKFTLFEPRGDDGLFYGIGSEMVVDYIDISSSNPVFYLTSYFDYTIPAVFNTSGSLIPWITLCYDNLPDTDRRKQAIKLDGGVKLDRVISNTIIALSWNSGDLLNSAAVYRWGYLKTSIEIKY
ncbi:hypothetical protein [Gracilinema caldarium]|uniref:hypothetical protein n=1 Tax=Gracilinema caldarium TaxID=215591 RepID=UPI0026EFD378|nr:hypothetical protein [Gracilinema caldarium]